ncbi:MAG: arylsulfatase [Verrucomicrobiales bacterium]|nr:arylsulfatase [Verrucomicrobiales bacterium]
MKLYQAFKVGLFAILSLSGVSARADSESTPNVVLIFADDLGYGDLGCYGATKVKTPNIDKLAAEGRRFTDAHSASAVCTPSRYGLMTGEYPFRAAGGRGLWGPAPITSPLLIDTGTETIADVFKSSGYETAAFGKWHLGFGEGSNDWQEPLRPGPQDLGFDYYFGMPVVNSAPPYVYVENDRIVGSDPEDPLVYLGRNAKGTTPITPIPPEAAQRSANQFSGGVKAHKLFNDFEVGTTLAGKATDWIKARGEAPFFLYFATTNVHHPFTPAERFQGSSEAGPYGDFVHELDWIVGEVMKSLEEKGVADNTLVIITSDNGGMFNHGGRRAAELGHKINGDLLGSKFGIWEGGHRVPFIAWWPEKIEAGTVSDQLINSVDLKASFAALTDQVLSPDEQKDSINMLPALTGDPEKPLRTGMFMTPHKPSHMSLRQGKWMFIPAQSDGGFTGSKPNQHAWGGAAVAKLVGTPNSDIENGKIKSGAAPAQLYDLEADVNQTTNLYYEHPEVTQKMSAAIRKAKGKATAAPGRRKNRGLEKYDGFEPLGEIHYSFESGALDDWTVISGDIGEPVTAVPSLAQRKNAPFARHGEHHLSTLVMADGESLSDGQIGVMSSPSFELVGGKVSFLVAGGFDEKDLFVALVDANSGEILIQGGGARDHLMRRIVWDVSEWKGRRVRFEVVDRLKGGWGHLNVDDISAQGVPAAVIDKK